MKRNTSCLLLLLLPASLGVTGCSDNNDNPGMGGSRERIELCVSGGGLTAVTRAETGDITPFDETGGITPFDATVFATTRQGVYTDLTGDYEWTKKVQVGADKSVTFTDATNPVPYYPVSGDWIYLTALAPEATSINSGSASYTLNSTQDLLYAKEIQGNKWDNYRFAGNPVSSNDKPLAFEHLLTQLQFKAVKTNTDGLSVTITKITVQKVATLATVAISDGAATFSGENDVVLTLSDNNVITNDTPIDLGNLLLPPLTSGTYTITVETSSGTFADVAIVLESGDTSTHFKAGISHAITLNITDTSLSISTVTVAPWTATPGGNLDLVE